MFSKGYKIDLDVGPLRPEREYKKAVIRVRPDNRFSLGRV